MTAPSRGARWRGTPRAGGARLPPVLVRPGIRQLRRRALDPRLGWEVQRQRLDRVMRALPVPRGTTVAVRVRNGVRTEEVLAAPPARDGAAAGPARPGGTVLHFHGGGYCVGSARMCRTWAAHLSARTACRVVLPEYRLAPPHAHPAALDDARAVLSALLSETPPGPVVVSGDSAGGGLALSLGRRGGRHLHQVAAHVARLRAAPRPAVRRRQRRGPGSLVHHHGHSPLTRPGTARPHHQHVIAVQQPLTNQMNVLLIPCMGRIAGVTAAETRQRLLRAAADVFAERGYDGTRVADIAAAAGVSNGALYAHFASKAELLVDALRTHGRRLLADVFAADPDRSVTDLLLVIGRWLPRRRGASGYLIVEALVAARRDEEVARPMRDYMGERADWIAELVRGAQAGGELDPALSPNALAHFCLLLAMGSALVTPDLHEVGDQEWSALLTRLMSALTPGGEMARRTRGRGRAAQRAMVRTGTEQTGATR